jgi:hypothetical protein
MSSWIYFFPAIFIILMRRRYYFKMSTSHSQKFPFLFVFLGVIVVIGIIGAIWYSKTADDRLYSQAEQNLQKGNYDLALQQITDYVEKYPQDAESKDREVKEMFRAIYFGRVDSLIRAGEVENGLKWLDDAKIYFDTSNQSQWDDKRVNIYIDWANTLSSKSRFHESLSKINEVRAFTLEGLQKDKVDQTERDIIKSFSESQRDEAEFETLKLASGLCGPGHLVDSPYPIFSVNHEAKTYIIYNTVDKSISHFASPSSIYYVACNNPLAPRLLEDCAYSFGGYHIKRYQQIANIELYNILTGENVASTQIKGTEPAVCKDVEIFSKGENIITRTGDLPSSGTLTNWIGNAIK